MLQKCDITFVEEGAAVRIAVFPLQRRAVPAVFLELKLALGDGQLQSLDGGHHDVRVSEAELQLLLVQSGKVLADGGRRPGLASLPLHHRVEKVLVLLQSPLLAVRLAAHVGQRDAAARYQVGALQRRLRVLAVAVVGAIGSVAVETK